ncbi:MAG: protein kinase [Polyangiaceae bacterium]
MPSSSKQKAESPVAPGELVVGKYRVERVIGAGGMGVVVSATHVELEQRVALKFLHPHILNGDSGAERFSREARAAVKLRSEHVARVYDVGVLPNGAPFSVMELLDGADVAAYAAANHPLTVNEAVEIVLQACDAIVEAHAAGIVHRDLKPQNLFITKKSNGAPLVKVLDFGVSKWMGAGEDFSLTDSSVVIGSPLYMAPEQMRAARNAEPRSDIWALGVILFELLAGRVPFDGATVTELCLKVVTEPPMPLLDLRADLPPGLVTIVTRCLEKDPDLRFENVALLAQALEPYASNAGSARGWRSMVETGDSLDVGDLPSEVATDSSRENLVSSAKRRSIDDRPPPSSRGPKRKAFAKGIAAGAALTVCGAIGGAIMWANATKAETPTTTTSAMTSASNATASAVEPDSPATQTSAVVSVAAPISSDVPVVAAAHSSTPLTHNHAPDPLSSARKIGVSASASTNAVTSPNGAPILH